METVGRTLQGNERMYMICKGQMQDVTKGDITGQVTFITDLVWRSGLSLTRMGNLLAIVFFCQFLQQNPLLHTVPYQCIFTIILYGALCFLQTLSAPLLDVSGNCIVL